MLYAQIAGERVSARPSVFGACCPICGNEVVAKCGAKRLKVWHWAHRKPECDPWAEPETAWHRNWKELFPAEFREVKMAGHRCDIKPPLFVIELQHSYLAPAEIEERELFYGNMMWIFDLRKRAHAISRSPDIEGEFRWPSFRKTLSFCRTPVFLLLARGELLNIWDYNPRTKAGRYRRFSKDEFIPSVWASTELGTRPVSLQPFSTRYPIKAPSINWEEFRNGIKASLDRIAAKQDDNGAI